ncbi:DUF4105 domain-containing protein [Muricoccus radiodurans]|uniref:DUF4105 domain-containing protein n=1 Tax=Muricoccus radiodurans TaxID=2231721 RepID=UPI003CF7FAF8
MATVLIWQNHFIDTSGGHTWTGHASLSITDHYTDTRALVDAEDNSGKMVVDGSSTGLVAGTDDYVSFWPGKLTDAGKKGVTNFNDGWKSGVKFMAVSKPSLFADVALENYAPDHVIRIKNLNVNKMVAKWRSIRMKQNASYKFLRKNCSTIVAEVLQVATPWYKTSHHQIWTPCDVRDYAMRVGKPMLWSDFIDELVANRYGTKEQLALLRGVKRRSAARGTSGGLAKFA